MPYDVEVQISLTVKGGPKATAKIKPAGITDANSKIVNFENNTMDTTKLCELKITGKPSRRVICKKFKLASACDVAFVAISAPRYKYKHCPTGETSGVGFLLHEGVINSNYLSTAHSESENPGCEENDKINWVDADYIVLDTCAMKCEKDKAQPTEKWIALFVDPAMFDCAKNPAEKFEITVLYGLVGDEAQVADPSSCCAVSTSPNQRMQNGRLVAMS